MTEKKYRRTSAAKKNMRETQTTAKKDAGKPARSAPVGGGKKKDLKRKKPAATYFPAKSSIIGVRELDFRVRNGNGYCLSTVATGIYACTYRAPVRSGAACARARMPASVRKGSGPGKKTFLAEKEPDRIL